MDIKMLLKDKKKVLIIAGIALVVILVIVAIVLLVLKDNSGTTDNNNDDTEKIELEYWGLWEPESVMQPLIDEYESTHENVTILYSQQTFTNYESRLFTRLQQSSSSTEPAPDIFKIHNTWTAKYYKYLTTLPSSVMTASTYASTFYPTAVSDFTAKDGNIYAIPLEIDGLMVFYNKQLLEAEGVTEIPTDWDSFVELAQTLTKKSSTGKITQAGLAMGTAENIKHSAEILSFLFLEEGMDIIDSTRTTVTLNTTKAAAVLSTYTSFATGDNATWSPTLGDDLEMFYSGKLAMMIAPSWRAFDIIQAAPTIEFGTAKLPQLAANEDEVYYSTYWAEAVSETCEHPSEAWDFIKFLSERTQQKEMFSNSSTIRAFGEPYSLAELNTELESKTYIEPIAQMADKMVSWQMGDESFVKASLNEAITSVVEDGTDPQAALKQAEEDINDQLAQTNR